jgi:hypothetical protein
MPAPAEAGNFFNRTAAGDGTVTKKFPAKSGLSLTLFLRLKKFRQRFREILTTPFQNSNHRRTCGGKLRFRYINL